jgi:hypothetical protein
LRFEREARLKERARELFGLDGITEVGDGRRRFRVVLASVPRIGGQFRGRLVKPDRDHIEVLVEQICVDVERHGGTLVAEHLLQHFDVRARADGQARGRVAEDRLRERNVGHKRSMALREYALGLESLHRFVEGEPLWRVHEAVFAVLAMESEPVDPRL